MELADYFDSLRQKVENGEILGDKEQGDLKTLKEKYLEIFSEILFYDSRLLRKADLDLSLLEIFEMIKTRVEKSIGDDKSIKEAMQKAAASKDIILNKENAAISNMEKNLKVLHEKNKEGKTWNTEDIDNFMNSCREFFSFNLKSSCYQLIHYRLVFYSLLKNAQFASEEQKAETITKIKRQYSQYLVSDASLRNEEFDFAAELMDNLASEKNMGALLNSSLPKYIEEFKSLRKYILELLQKE